MGPHLARLCGALANTTIVAMTHEKAADVGADVVLGKTTRGLELGMFLVFYSQERIASASTRVLESVPRSSATEVLSTHAHTQGTSQGRNATNIDVLGQHIRSCDMKQDKLWPHRTKFQSSELRATAQRISYTLLGIARASFIQLHHFLPEFVSRVEPSRPSLGVWLMARLHRARIA